MREALANIWWPRLEGARVLDLFAGTGDVGLELLSRGAGSLVLVDGGAPVVAAIRRRLAERPDAFDGTAVAIRRLDLPAGLGRLAPSAYDLIFADPPYDFEGYVDLLAGAAPLASPGAQMVIEHRASRDVEAAPPWRPVDRRRYGDCALSFFELAAGDGASSR